MNELIHREFKLKLPMRFRTSSKKVTALNLNVYRNLHFRSLTALKHRFQDYGKQLLRDAGIPPLGRIRLRYQVFAKTRREFDVANICSIVDKFFSDTLIYSGIIEDDNWKFLDDVSFGFGGFTTNEHVLVTITEIEPRKENTMRVLLDEDEIQTALETFVETLGLTGVTGVELSSDNDGNINAEVLIGEAKTTKPTYVPVKNKVGRPRGSKNKPKEDENDVENTGAKSNSDPSSGDSESPKAEADNHIRNRSSFSKNLFGDEEIESSENNSPEKAKDVSTRRVKKSSIFDQ